VIDRLPLVQIEGAGQLLQVHHVGQVGLGEAQDAEWPSGGGVTAGLERNDLDGHVRPFSRFEEVRQLPAHDAGAPDRASQHGLIQRHPQMRRLRPGEQGLPGHPQPNAPLDLIGWSGLMAKKRDGVGIFIGLQQAGHELDLIRADARGGFLKAQISLEPAGQDVGVVVPPAVGVGVARERQQRRALVLVGHPVEGEHGGDVPVLEPDPAGLEPLHFGLRRADHLPGVLDGDAPGLAQTAKLGTKQDAQHGRPAAAWRGDHVAYVRVA
jgi:hypothetical protein